MSGSAEEQERPEEGGAEQASQEEATLASMLDAIRQAKVSELLLSTVSTLVSVAYGKLDVKDTAEAKRAIDALLPLLEGDLDEQIKRDFKQADTNLKLAYAGAVTSSD